MSGEPSVGFLVDRAINEAIAKAVLLERLRLASILANCDNEEVSALATAICGISIPFGYMVLSQDGVVSQYQCRKCNKKFVADAGTKENYKETAGNLTPACPNKKCIHNKK